jgi:hypothetical protein
MNGLNTQSEEPIETEPLSADELIRNLMQDLITDSPPDDLANEIVEEFVLNNREETPQILAMLEAPDETLVEMLKGIVGQSYQVQLEAIDERGIRFVSELKSAVVERMQALAEEQA